MQDFVLGRPKCVKDKHPQKLIQRWTRHIYQHTLCFSLNWTRPNKIKTSALPQKKRWCGIFKKHQRLVRFPPWKISYSISVTCEWEVTSTLHSQLIQEHGTGLLTDVHSKEQMFENSKGNWKAQLSFAGHLCQGLPYCLVWNILHHSLRCCVINSAYTQQKSGHMN